MLPQDHASSNILEQYYPRRDRLTAIGMGDFHELEQIYPGLKYVKGDALAMPFDDGSFDWSFSHAVIEHAGSAENQELFVSELIRVSRKGVFLTSPSRLHPVEFHTGLPLLHYLPRKLHLSLYKRAGHGFYCTEENLNLLYPREFGLRVSEAAGRLGLGERVEIRKDYVRWLGFPSNIIYVVYLK